MSEEKHQTLRCYIGERIEAARQAAGRQASYISVGKLAKMCGLKPSTISHYERGEGDIPMFRLLDIASALGRPLSYFLPPDTLSKQLSKRVHALPVEQQEVVERLVEVFETANARK